MRRTIRSNRWHVVKVYRQRDDAGVLEIRVSSDPDSNPAAAYVSAAAGRKLIRALCEALRVKEADDTKRSRANRRRSR